jgi:poly(hydroxyalkanoate) depolymerase family esterase
VERDRSRPPGQAPQGVPLDLDANAQSIRANLAILPQMRKRIRTTAWARTFQRQFVAMSRLATAAGKQALGKAPRLTPARRKPPAEAGAWIPGVAIGAAGARRFRLYRPPGIQPGERLPLLVMLHGCGQDAESFAASTRMNRVALRERFWVLYPEQDRLANAQGCWNWFDTDSGRAFGEVALILKAIDQVCLLHPVDRHCVAIAGLSAGASMAALLVTRHPDRFKALVMHSGIPPGTAHSTLTALGAMHGNRPTVPPAAGPGTRAADWPPLLVIHGSADNVVSPRNGQAAVQLWAQAAGAKPGDPRRVQRGQRYPMSVTDFKHKGHTVATLAEVQGLAHAWSGGAARQPFSDAHGADASRMIWAFVSRQFKTQGEARLSPAPSRAAAR